MCKSIFEIYGDFIKAMREHGYSLQAIGDTIGVTKQAVDLALKTHYPGVKPMLIPEEAVAKMIGCSIYRLRILRKKGTINPKHRNSIWRYSRDDIDAAMVALQRVCAHCGKPLPLKWNRKYCDICLSVW